MNFSRYPLQFLFFLILLWTFSAGCGYHFRTDGKPVGLNMKSIAIPLITSASSEKDFEADFTRKIREEFISHAGIPIVDKEKADMILSCRVYEIESQPLTYNSIMQNVQGRTVTHETTSSRRLMMRMDARLIERATGKTIWREKSMKEEARFNVTSDPLVTRYNQQQAIKEISELFAEKIYMMTMERF
jgi:outer membrane lipopolysaccharide assembly protein LptE/RlpB